MFTLGSKVSRRSQITGAERLGRCMRWIVFIEIIQVIMNVARWSRCGLLMDYPGEWVGVYIQYTLTADPLGGGGGVRRLSGE